MFHKGLQVTFKKVRSYSFTTNGILKHYNLYKNAI